MTVTATTAVRYRPAAADFESVRSRLLGIAYRIVGRAADAEDVVQDVWIRWHGADRAEVRDPVAFLVTVTTRTALNAATSARARREVSAGGWLPELHPANADPSAVDPVRAAERGEALELAVQLLMERLLPVERAVYVLHEAFDYPFREIADALKISEANARQLARRARQHLGEQRTRPVDPAERSGLLRAFLDAARDGDTARLINRLSPRCHVPIRPRPDSGFRAASGASSDSPRTPSAPPSAARAAAATRTRSSAG
jgi:RNA polymerase sigma-70 factor, ECF subfamily